MLFWAMVSLCWPGRFQSRWNQLLCFLRAGTKGLWHHTTVNCNFWTLNSPYLHLFVLGNISAFLLLKCKTIFIRFNSSNLIFLLLSKWKIFYIHNSFLNKFVCNYFVNIEFLKIIFRSCLSCFIIFFVYSLELPSHVILLFNNGLTLPLYVLHWYSLFVTHALCGWRPIRITSSHCILHGNSLCSQ